MTSGRKGAKGLGAFRDPPYIGSPGQLSALNGKSLAPGVFECPGEAASLV